MLLLERGRNVEHIKDYVNATKAPWEYPHRGGRTKAMEEAYPVLKRDYPLNEKNLAFWVNDKESPYTEVKRFDWYRGYQVGGRSLMWGRQSYRWSDFDFEANAQGRHRHRLADPLRGHRAVVRPRREARRHRAARAKECRSSPTASSSPPMPLNCGEELVAGAAERSCSTASGASSRAAPRTRRRQLEGRNACQYRNACWLGCPVRRVLQHAVVHAAGGGEDGQAHAQAVVDRQRGAVRQEREARDRRARHSTP